MPLPGFTTWPLDWKAGNNNHPAIGAYGESNVDTANFKIASDWKSAN